MNPVTYMESYGELYDFLKDTQVIEDWGCGNQIFKSFVLNSIRDVLFDRNEVEYIGIENEDIDTTSVDSIDYVTNFKDYRSDLGPEFSILMNIGLHKYPYWKRIFVNALESNPRKIACIVPNHLLADAKNYMKIYSHYSYQLHPSNQSTTSILLLTRSNLQGIDGVGIEGIGMGVNEKNGRIAVCTVILHNYDVPKDVSKCPYDDIDFFLFTDDREFCKDKGWILMDATNHLTDVGLDIGGLKSISVDSSANVICKWYKTCIHRVPELKKYSRLCVIDASLEMIDFSLFKVTDPSINWDEGYKSSDGNLAPMVFYRHPYRNDIVSEASAALAFCRYVFQPVCQQADSYMKEGYPNEYLLASGYYMRDNDPKINRAFELWYLEIQKWTDLCQLSLLYSFWVMSLAKPFLMPDDIFCGKWVRFHHHVFNY
jgi:hypothetical protein